MTRRTPYPWNPKAFIQTLQAMDSGGPILLFDGTCGLCRRAVLFTIARDPAGVVRYASLQSGLARDRLAPLGIHAAGLDTLVLLEGARVSLGSTAALRLCGHLARPWPAMTALLVVPRPLRDAVYAWVARRRYRWFGRHDACWIPTPELRSRFLDV